MIWCSLLTWLQLKLPWNHYSMSAAILIDGNVIVLSHYWKLISFFPFHDNILDDACLFGVFCAVYCHGKETFEMGTPWNLARESYRDVSGRQEYHVSWTQVADVMQWNCLLCTRWKLPIECGLFVLGWTTLTEAFTSRTFNNNVHTS